MTLIYINNNALNKIKNNQKTLEIRKKNKYTDNIKKIIIFSNGNNIIKKYVKKIIIINDIKSYINSIDIKLTGFNNSIQYFNKLKSLYKKMPKTFVAIYLS